MRKSRKKLKELKVTKNIYDFDFTCNFCAFVCMLDYNFIEHMRGNHMELVNKSDSSMSASEESEDELVATELENGSIECNTDNEEQIKDQIILYGSETSEESLEKDIVSNFKCDSCDFNASTNENLNEHNLTLFCSHSIWPFQLYMDTFHSIWTSLALYMDKGKF